MKKLLTLALVCLSVGSASAQNGVMDFYNARVKALQTEFSVKRQPAVKVKDEANGFISYSLLEMGGMGFEELAYFKAKNGKKIAASARFSCGPLCGAAMPSVYEWKNGALVDKSETYLPMTVATQAEAYAIEKQDALQAKLGESVPLGIWVKIPRVGTTIQIGVMEGAMEDGKFHLACELQFNAATATFKLVKK